MKKTIACLANVYHKGVCITIGKKIYLANFVRNRTHTAKGEAKFYLAKLMENKEFK